MVSKKKEKSQTYQTKFSHVFPEAFLSKISKNQPKGKFTDLFKNEIFFMVIQKNQKANEKEIKSQIQCLLLFITALGILANELRRGKKREMPSETWG